MLHFVSTVTPKEIVRNKVVTNFELYSSGVPFPEAMDEFHNSPNPAPTIHPLPDKGKMGMAIKTVHNP